MWAEKQSFEKKFTSHGVKIISELPVQEPYIVGVELYGDILTQKTASSLNFPIVVDDKVDYVQSMFPFHDISVADLTAVKKLTVN